MKRCSQCEFVYEDEQGVCDMDGSALVYEPTLYPPANATTTSTPKFRSRSFILTAAATLIMGSFLAIGFYGVTIRSAPPTSAVTPIQSESVPPSVVVEPAMAATPVNKSSEPAREADSTADTKSRKLDDESRANASSGSAASKPAAGSKTATTREAKKPAPAQPKNEDGSKVGTLLKKTGRILKKPFKF